MPGPILQDPTPSWMRPENASVLDPWYVKAARAAGRLIGADDPVSQLFALGAPMQVPKGTLGGLAAKTAEKAAVPGGSLQELTNYIKAYHGSPHDFERFDISKIGTGEGAQAYGHGLYFAENPSVAQDYRRALSRTAIKLRGEPLNRAEVVTQMQGPKWLKMTADQHVDLAAKDLLTSAQQESVHAMSPEQLVDSASANARILRHMNKTDAEQVAHWTNVENKIKEMLPHLETQGGKMYEVAIKADPEHFLDWDKPLSQQSEKVKAVLGQIPEVKAKIESEMKILKKSDPSGRSLYAAMSNWHQGTDLSPEAQAAAKVSQTLREKGVPGIKYLDQGSRAAGEGSRNYVVFDDKTIEIMKKYGLLPPAVGLGVAASQQQ